jgi:YHS domain-containing protein
MKPLILAMAMIACVAPAAPAFAAKPPVCTAPLSDVAAGGYDVVAYFTQGAPVKGDKVYSMTWKGATWQFASAGNLVKFKANPAAYAPQYGGYCAWAVANGYTAKGDPRNWKIVGGKLYLNYNDDVQSKWLKDIPGFIRKGDGNWPSVLGK